MVTMSTSGYHHGALRAALLDVAEHAIDEGAPAHALSMRELAREVGVSHAAPYKHFEDRVALVEALAARWLDELCDEQRLAAVGDPREALLAAGRAYVRWGVRHPRRIAIMYDPTINHGPDAESALGAAAARHAELLASLVGDAARVGVVGDAQVDAARLWATVHGLATLVSLGHLPAASVDAVLEASLAPSDSS